MKKPGFPLWLVAVLVLLLGGLIAVTTFNNRTIQTFGDHDHDHDGKPDHGSDAHN